MAKQSKKKEWLEWAKACKAWAKEVMEWVKNKPASDFETLDEGETQGPGSNPPPPPPPPNP